MNPANAAKNNVSAMNVEGSGTAFEGTQVFVAWFEVTVAPWVFTKLASIVSVPGEPFDV